MEDKSNIDILKEFARITNRQIVAKEAPYPKRGIYTFQKFKRMVYIPNNPTNSSFFIWYSDPYYNVGYPEIFCGAFIPISSRIKSKVRIRNKYITDKLNFFPNSKRQKLGNAYFDSKTVILGSMDTAAKRLFSQARIQDQFVEALGIDKLINISVNEYNIDFVPELKNQSYLSIINPQSWYTERNDIEKLFKQMEKIRSNITNI